MILSKADYILYLAQDFKANNIAFGDGSFRFRLKNFFRRLLNPNPIEEFFRRLRKAEYYYNCPPPSILSKLYAKYNWIRFKRISLKNGFTIPLNTFDSGLSIAHSGTIVVNGASRIGKNCRIHVCVNIGTAKGCGGAAPRIGNNVYIGPGAKIYGPIQIADDCVIGANAVVNRDCCIPGTKLLGIPAKEYR